MLRWGLDKAADTCRLLRVGLTYGAVVMARAQFERWTLNVAFHHKVTGIGDTESTADYVRRVWSVYPDVAESLDVGLAWSELSEWLHGRGLITAALGEIVDAADGAVPGEQPGDAGRDGGGHAGRSPAGGCSGGDRAAPGAGRSIARGRRALRAQVHPFACRRHFPRTRQSATSWRVSCHCSTPSTSGPSSAARAGTRCSRPRFTGCSSAILPLLTCSPPGYRRLWQLARCWNVGAGPSTEPGWPSKTRRKGSAVSSPRNAWR